MLDTHLGQLICCAAMVDDVASLILLAMISSAADTGPVYAISTLIYAISTLMYAISTLIQEVPTKRVQSGARVTGLGQC